MKLKKITAFLLCSLVALPLAGCNKPLPPTDSGTSSKSSKPGNSSAAASLVPEPGASLKFQTDSASDSDFAKAVAENFKKKYGVNVTVEEGGLNNDEKISLECTSGTGPDVLISSDDKSEEGIDGKYFLQLDDSIAKKLNSEITPIAMKTVTKDGNVYGVPVSLETYVLFYNKKLVKTPITTFEQLAKEAKAYNNPKKNKFYYLFDASTGSPLYTVLTAGGFTLFGNGTDYNKPGFDTPEYKKGLEALQKYHEIVPTLSANLGDTDFLDTQFEKGNTAYILSGPWDVKTFRDAGVDLGVVGLPTYEGRQQKSYVFIKNAHVSRGTKYPVAAQLFAESLVSSESAELLYSKANKITSLKDVSQISGLSDPAMKTIINAFSNSELMPRTERMNYFWTITKDECAQVFDGTLKPDQAVSKSEQEWNTFVSEESKTSSAKS